MSNASLLQNKFKGNRGKGWHPDTHDKSKDQNSRALFGAAIRVPAEFSLEQYVSQIWDQGQTSSCVGWAFAQSIKLRLAVAGTSIELPTPEGIYVTARAQERALAGLTPDQSPLQDNGCQPSLAVQGMNLVGVASMTAWPFDPSTINNEPKFEELEVASAFKLTGYARVNSDGSQRLADIKQAISSGYPVAIGTQVDQAFEAYNGTGIIQAPNPLQLLGGHMMHLIGYRADGSFRGVNQWGTSWGDSGFYWASSDWVASSYLSDAYILTCTATGHVGQMVRKAIA